MTERGLRDDDYLVHVKAQVMTRDDSTGGWVPMGGGGMSIVGLRKLVVSNGEDVRHEYHIHGQRIADQSMVLNCVLKKDVQYTKANPTFHHWKTEDKRFGLTFQSSKDARAFDKGVKRAVEDLLEGSPDSNLNGDLEVGDDEVFMTLDLPLGRKDSSSQSASTASTTTSSPTPQSPALSNMADPFTSNSHPNNQHLHRVHYITRHPKQHQQMSPPSSDKSSSKSSSDSVTTQDVWVRSSDKNGSSSKIKSDHCSSTTDDNIELSEDYSYVQFNRNRPSVHEYSYPMLDSISKAPSRRDSISSLKKHNLEILPQLPMKSKKKRGKDKKKKDRKKKKVPTATLR